jgi:hypothetical protein
MELMEHQLDVIDKLDSGKILWGGVGSGKGAAVLGYYVEKESPRDIYVITTAKKRDSLDWIGEGASFGIGTSLDDTCHGVMTVDSWNNIGNYVDVEDAFFVFDEQRLVGRGAWVKTFLKIAKKNRWILLSATPGDTWMDYAPVFVANGFYRNLTQFRREHVVYASYSRYPKIERYLGERKLEVLRNDILVEMPFVKHTERALNWLSVGYDSEAYRKLYKERWNFYEDQPVKDAAVLFRLMRRVVNSDPSRLEMIRKLLMCHPRLIVFYNFDYELEILRKLADEVEVGEWNGHRKQPLPQSEKWVYLVQYVSGAEGWNCTDTDAMVLYSLTYSYKNFEQVQGRIDRLNTKYTTLFYYIFVSNSGVDRAIQNSLRHKKSFNERRFLVEHEKFGDVDPKMLDAYLTNSQI